MTISVIICTHNPRRDYLARVLEALRLQSMLKDQWELLLIDNASFVPLSDHWDLSWHPYARTIREDEIGLTPARLRGIKESNGDVLVFVDDDNVLDPNYLSIASDLAADCPCIGAFGANIKGEFEIPPPNWILPYLEGLAVSTLERDYWSNLGEWSLASPYGAGLCVRRLIAEDYTRKVAQSDVRRVLGRSGVKMGAGEDGDIAWCAVDLGMGTARFASLRLTHLIPKNRLTADYIVRLMAGFAASREILSFIREHGRVGSVSASEDQIRFLFNLLRSRGIQRRILVASAKARKEARQMISAYESAAESRALL